MTPRRDPERIEPAGADADVVIGANVKAKRLRFRSKPQVHVELRGEVRERGRRSPATTSSGSERERLPEEVEPGVTYRDVRVRWAATARLRHPPPGGE